MRLESKDIVGLPVKTARDLMRHLNVYRIDAETVLEFLNDEHWRGTVDAARKANPAMKASGRGASASSARSARLSLKSRYCRPSSPRLPASPCRRPSRSSRPLSKRSLKA